MSHSAPLIALVDDDLEFAERLVDYFTPRKLKIRHFERAEAMLMELRASAGESSPFDLVLTDLKMPEMDGMELTRQVKQLRPELPVIVMTADSSVDAAIEAVEAGATDHIVKPPNLPHLSVVLRRTLHFAHLANENVALKRAIQRPEGGAGIVAKSPALLRAIQLAKRIAPSDATALITGESGTGKEVFARLIHRSSRRADRSFVPINCAAIPENLLESEFFGHAKGSFTGADSARAGLFEEADGGTLFLDEIGDLPMHLQSKLLRVLQERKVKRVGENTYREVDVRIIAATLRNLSDEVAAKRFREDLFYRLNVIPIRLPGLRERREDILPLARNFLESFSARYAKPFRGFTRDAAEWLLTRNWPGNVRELENTIERAAVVVEGDVISRADLDFDAMLDVASATLPPSAGTVEAAAAGEESAGADAESLDRLVKDAAVVDVASATSSVSGSDAADAPAVGIRGAAMVAAVADPSGLALDWESPITLAELEMRYIRQVMDRCGSVKDRAARVLGIDRKTLYRKLQDQPAVPELQ